MLPVFDAQNQLRAFKRELRRLEDLSLSADACALSASPHAVGQWDGESPLRAR